MNRKNNIQTISENSKKQNERLKSSLLSSQFALMKIIYLTVPKTNRIYPPKIERFTHQNSGTSNFNEQQIHSR